MWTRTQVWHPVYEVGVIQKNVFVFDGQVMLVFLALYAVLRFVLEYFRADDRGGLFGLSTSQLVGVGALVAVGVLWRQLAQRSRG